MTVLGIVLTAIGLLLIFAFSYGRIKCKTETEAVIVKVIEKKYYHRGRITKDCTPVFSYTVRGKEYSAKAESSTSNPDKYHVGQKVTVYVDDANPENVRFGSSVGFFIAGVVIALLGVFTLVLVFI